MKYPAVANYLNGSFVEDTLPALDTVHHQTLPFRVNRLQFDIRFLTSQSLYLVQLLQPNYDCSLLNTANTTFLSNNTVSPSNPYALGVGVQLFAVYSHLDGLYYQEVTRLDPGARPRGSR